MIHEGQELRPPPGGKHATSSRNSIPPAAAAWNPRSPKTSEAKRQGAAFETKGDPAGTTDIVDPDELCAIVEPMPIMVCVEADLASFAPPAFGCVGSVWLPGDRAVWR